MNQPLLTPQLLAQTKDLSLIAKLVAQGALQGEHTSRQRGVGAEFSQYRAYEPGDEISKIDWKLFARSHRYFVREAERESDINVWLMIDCSASMLEACDNSGLSKIDYARIFAAALAHIACFQGDSVGLVGLSVEKPEFIPALSGTKHLNRCFVGLHNLRSGDAFPDVSQIQYQLMSARKNALIFVLSDFYQQSNEIIDFIKQISCRYSDVHPLQLSTNIEHTFELKGRYELEDRETGEKVKVNAETIREQYLSNRQRYLDEMATNLGAYGASMQVLNISLPIEQTLLNVVNTMRWQPR
ncbi:DUF58 domain-containing protein [Alteromonas facilis]|uniref:DUF58 domain-containing protein n=1 Tax=Alteromonas facilis TaxID=2048004 RepID=UPI000C28C6C8|nr:DUF58 domain-containing protein [Alteromonas facilis]